MTTSDGRVGQKSSSSKAGGFGCRCFIVEEFRIDLLAVQVDVCEPSPSFLIERNATVSRRGFCTSGQVLGILGTSGGSEVDSTIVEFVQIDVVAFYPIVADQPEQLSVHLDAVPSDSVLALLAQVPCPLTNPLSISSVNSGVGHNGAIASEKWNAGRQSVFAENDGLGVLCEVTDSRAERSRLDGGNFSLKGLSASLTNEHDSVAWVSHRLPRHRTEDGLHGTILVHRVPPELGATPRTVSAVAGFRVA